MSPARQTSGLRQTRWYAYLRDCRYLWRQRARRRFYRSLLSSGKRVFDIGANVGHYALIFRSLGCRVVAVEPQAELAAGLTQRFGSTNPWITVESCALGAQSGEATLHKTANLSEVASLRSDIGQRSRFAADHPFVASETVNVLTLEDLIKRHGAPDFCKIDVEGFELEVLKGLRTPVRLLSFEFNAEFLNTAIACLTQLSGIGPYRFNYSLGETPAFADETWCDAAALVVRLKASSDPLLWGDIYARLETS